MCGLVRVDPIIRIGWLDVEGARQVSLNGYNTTKITQFMPNLPPIVDTFGRIHRNLRVSVTDRCNIRCQYCMPEHVDFLPSTEVLSFEEITRLVSLLAQMGINRVRLTGGEPLVRKDLPVLVKMLKSIDGINDLAMTTNGVLLRRHASALKSAGLDRLNISLDTLDPETFHRLTRRNVLSDVLDGIAAARECGFEKIRLNAVSIAGLTEAAIVPLANFARTHGLELRFIEFMPLDGDQNWGQDKVLDGEQIRSILEQEFGALAAADRDYEAQPAMDFHYADGTKVGFINPVSQPFCSACDRLRLTAEGKLRNCLFSLREWDVKDLIRSGASEDSIESVVRECIGNKKRGHGIDSVDFVRPQKAMYQIGG